MQNIVNGLGKVIGKLTKRLVTQFLRFFSEEKHPKDVKPRKWKHKMCAS